MCFSYCYAVSKFMVKIYNNEVFLFIQICIEYRNYKLQQFFINLGLLVVPNKFSRKLKSNKNS